MNIILSGYGRMGKTVEEQARQRGHTIAATVDSNNEWEAKQSSLKNADVIIDFSLPDVIIDNIYKAFKLDIPFVTGTTAWYDNLEEISTYCRQHNKSLFYAPNFSIGVNIFFELNRKLAELMSDQQQYHVQIEETHHVHKKDAPSGTAARLADDISYSLKKYSGWEKEKATRAYSFPVISYREDEVPGTHQVVYNSEVDKITIQHEAKSRKGFALGAVLAAEFLAGKKGVYTMKDLIFSNF